MWIFRKLLGPVRRFLERRRFPTLFGLLAVLLAVNLIVPDPLPFIDEVIMLIVTVIVGMFRRRPARERADRER